MTRAKQPPTHVVAAAVMDAAGHVLIAQRPAGKHLAGGWEFPGGKLMAGEDRRAGLARELREELGISLSAPPRPLIRVRHTYPSGEVLIDMWVVRFFEGDPEGLDGQALRWVTQEALEHVELLPADGPIVAALRLPERLTAAATRDYVVGDSAEPDAGGRLRGVLCAGLADAMAASDAGAGFIVLKNELPHGELRSICEMVPMPVYTPG
ncbi:MAG TPA: (deoxy)nucleoside triphosphate pyrophosphohydrolase, partial [Steroidobacteraceae bacterium]|nr:(deoxy)nucleoside triphosphate pyrophosphohydrolase [Steroidobacteraceae bacterium]